MPELPEVETIRRGIIQKLKGKVISEVEIRVPKLFLGNKRDIVGAKIIDAKRVAKVLEIVLDNGFSILIHLKLTGQLVYQSRKTKDQRLKTIVGGHPQKAYEKPLPHEHTHIIYTFTDGSRLYFNDLRKFGWHRVVKSFEVEKLLGPDKFGPEPGAKEFNLEYLKKIFSKSRKKIKEIITDQAKISGIGNIYSSEALYKAGILPNRESNSLKDFEIKKLKSAIEEVIRIGLKCGGSSENTYVDIEGKKGKYMDVAMVYQQEKDPRGHILKTIKIGGRTAFYCATCQK